MNETAIIESQQAAGSAAVDAYARKGKVTFFLLLLFTIVLFVRPSDFLLMPLRVAEFLAVAVILSYVVARMQGAYPFIWTKELKLMLALTGWFIVGVPFAFWRTNSLTILTENWLKTIVIFFLLTQTVLTLGRVRKLLWILVLCMSTVFVYTIVTYGAMAAEIDERIMGDTKGFLSGNHAGIAAAMIIPFIAALLSVSRSFLQTVVLLASLGAAAWMAILTASRAGALAVFVSVAVTWLFILRGSIRARFFGVVCAAGLGLAIAAAPGIFWMRLSTLWVEPSVVQTDEQRSATESTAQRRALLVRSIHYTLEDPIFGLGLGNFPIASGARTGDAQSWKNTHNTFTQISSEAGIPGLIMFIMLLGHSMRQLWRLGKRQDRHTPLTDLQVLSKATLISIGCFAFAGLFAGLAYDYYLYYLIALGVGLQGAAANQHEQSFPELAESREPQPAMEGAER